MSTKSSTKNTKSVNTPKVKEVPTEIFIPLGQDFDWSTVVITEPETKSFSKQGQGSIETTTSQAYVPGPNGEKLQIYFQIATQKVWGINGNWELNTPKEQQTPENLKGFQIAYPLTSTETFTCPTADEIHTKNCFDEISKISLDFVTQECENKRSKKADTRKIAAVTYNSYIAGKNDDDLSTVVKPIYDWVKSEDKTTKQKYVNKQKPQNSYLKLVTRGQKPNLVCATSIYGPGDKLVSPLKYMRFSDKDKPILTEVDSVVHFEGLFYGAHGKTPYGASIKLRVVQMSIRPAMLDSSLPKRRMLPANTAVEATSEDDDGGVGDFQSPLVSASASSVKQSSDFEDLTQKPQNVDGDSMSDDGQDHEEPKVEEVKPDVIVKSHKKKHELKEKRTKS